VPKNLAPKLERALAERVDWINRVTQLAADDNWQAVQRAIDELDHEHLRSMIYVLVLARGSDLRRARDATAYERFDLLGDRRSVHLN
jgi:hypothetical protein